ncbi:KUP/HAK/KT family potassium transporter, partial [Acinetobacter baumannii]
GGGTAYLELTGEDLLDTGVAIMARPPGKKNSTIHLLSGGEKALTALALRGMRPGHRRTGIVMAIGVMGASLFYGDSLITPAISVLSAV